MADPSHQTVESCLQDSNVDSRLFALAQVRNVFNSSAILLVYLLFRHYTTMSDKERMNGFCFDGNATLVLGLFVVLMTYFFSYYIRDDARIKSWLNKEMDNTAFGKDPCGVMIGFAIAFFTLAGISYYYTSKDAKNNKAVRYEMHALTVWCLLIGGHFLWAYLA